MEKNVPSLNNSYYLQDLLKTSLEKALYHPDVGDAQCACLLSAMSLLILRNMLCKIIKLPKYN